jgi:DNA polymerase/3'-5' exonuclease PolX
MEISVVGSYRRGVKTSGDIDVLIRHTNDKNLLKAFVNKLIENKYITDVLSLGGKKHAGICKIPGGKNRRLDILFTSKEEYPFALYYFTGSGSFNVVIRKKATELGYKLNEYGIKKLNSNSYLSGFKTEKDIFKLLKVEYLEPKDRYPMNVRHL